MIRRWCFAVLLGLSGIVAAGSGAAAQSTEAPEQEEAGEPAPPEPDLPSVLERLRTTPGTSLFAELVRLAGKPEIFTDGGPMTVFVPPDEVLIAAFNDHMRGAEGDAYQKRLTKFVLSHVLREQYSIEDMRYNITMTGGRSNLETVSGDAVTLRIRDEAVVVFDERNNAVPIAASFMAADGVIHKLDGAMLTAR